MKKAVYMALALIMALSLAACGNSDADRSDNTKDGVIGDGMNDLERDVKDAGDDIGSDIRGAADDITGRGAMDNGANNGDVNGSVPGGMIGGTAYARVKNFSFFAQR